MKPTRLLLTLALLGGCSILPESEPLDIYPLPAKELPAQSPTVNWALKVETPNSERMLDSTRILVVPKAAHINAYQGARWSEHAPELVRNRLLDAFRDDGRIQALSSDEQNLYADLALTSTLRRFNSRYEDGIVSTQIQLDAQLVNVRDQSIVASRRFKVSTPSATAQIGQVVAAFGTAADELSQQVIHWVVETGSGLALAQPPK
ncbi:ABC-type transport auxiliary lipoprotein family protein [Ectopseudomonas mendocina]|uniref:ABC-type transport auxiliary lipoprotein family protein n=1 Tax=Ectopseudomonas mendocina TaxID=300 RepID=A0ABZ2REX0_ECTME